MSSFMYIFKYDSTLLILSSMQNLGGKICTEFDIDKLDINNIEFLKYEYFARYFEKEMLG